MTTFEKLIPLRALVIIAGSALVLLSSTGCATGTKLRAQASEIKDLNSSIHDRAYRCAPEDLAISEATVEFGLYELSQGNFVQARRHLRRAEEHARLADKRSDYDLCRDQQVEVAVKTTEKVEIERDPGPQDRDGDGLIDSEDRCPFEPEDFEGFMDDDGCPDLDNDGDGIADLNDQCLNESEDFDAFQDDDGCPDADNDDDAIADALDACPETAEDYDGDMDSDGCPEERKLVKIEDDQIRLNEKVFFAYDKSDILPQSYPLLNEVADVLLNNPSIEIRVEGHTDSRGSDRYNLKLSRERAASVRQYLIGRGVAPERMLSEGFGESRPIDDNNTEAGRAANRRVELHITKK